MVLAMSLEQVRRKQIADIRAQLARIDQPYVHRHFMALVDVLIDAGAFTDDDEVHLIAHSHDHVQILVKLGGADDPVVTVHADGTWERV